MRLLKILLLFFIVINGHLDIHAQWQYISPYPPRLGAYSSCVVGNKAYFWCANNTIISTSDGGESFKIYPPYTPVLDVALGCCNTQGLAFADTMIGYITDGAYGEFRTTDGGNSWVRTENVGSNITIVVFGSDKFGWKFGDGGILKTTNAGLSWFYVSMSVGWGGIFSKAFALNQRDVWLLKSYYPGREIEGSIWYTPNGGITWSRLNTGYESDTIQEVRYNDIYMNFSGVGFAVGTIYRKSMNTRNAFILRTTDMGKTWSNTEIQDCEFIQIININENEWILLGNKGTYGNYSIIQLKTTNMGESWDTYTSLNVGSYFYTAAYIPKFNSLIIMTNGGIFKSYDKGDSYIKVTSNMDIFIKDIEFEKKPISSLQQIAIGYTPHTREYILSTDGGLTWSKKTIPSSLGNYIWRVKIAEQTIYMIVDQLYIYRSTDLGNSWKELNVPVYSGLQALDVYDKNNFVLSAYRYILSSTDGGNSWILGPFPNRFWLNSSFIVKPKEIIAVGGFYDSLRIKGIIYKTTDAGFNWRIEKTQNEIEYVSMINENLGFAHSNYQLYRTTNGGKTWHINRKSSNYYVYYSAIGFMDSTFGLLRESFYFLETTNFGQSWKRKELNLPIMGGLNKIAFNARGDLFVVGQGMLMMLPANTIYIVNREIDDLNSYFGYRKDLIQNFPNPFNSTTNFIFQINEQDNVSLKIYDVLGREVSTLINEVKQPGEYLITWDGSLLPSGVYYYRFQTKSVSRTKKMLLIK